MCEDAMQQLCDLIADHCLSRCTPAGELRSTHSSKPKPTSNRRYIHVHVHIYIYTVGTCRYRVPCLSFPGNDT